MAKKSPAKKYGDGFGTAMTHRALACGFCGAKPACRHQPTNQRRCEACWVQPGDDPDTCGSCGGTGFYCGQVCCKAHECGRCRGTGRPKK